ncbi:hypothetical protein [Erwinia sp. E602]|uniref:hypothetical protein n=1 Tax=Erwinia sp. E602 TaxID=2675378 RepID=UPI001BA6FFE5|nr:hypothetical protein [Erwinia sp. E602]
MAVADTFAGREAPVRSYQPWTESGCAPPLTLAPDGKPWPAQARQLQQKEKKKGHSSLRLDNSKNQQDIYVKVSRVADKQSKNFARSAFIPAGQQLKLLEMAVGEYVVKLMDIKNGCVQVSRPMRLNERRTEKQIEFSDASLTFYNVVNGNTELNKLSAANF